MALGASVGESNLSTACLVGLSLLYIEKKGDRSSMMITVKEKRGGKVVH